jgi:hypothetical protein
LLARHDVARLALQAERLENILGERRDLFRMLQLNDDTPPTAADGANKDAIEEKRAS